MIIPDDTSRFDRVFAFVTSSEEIKERVHQFLYWIFEREPQYLDILDATAVTCFDDKCIIDWNNGNLYVSAEFALNDVTVYVKTATENVQIYHPVTIKVVDDAVYYMKEIGL